MTEDTVEHIEEVEIIEPNGNVISFSKEEKTEENPEFTFPEFLRRADEFKDDIEDFIVIAVKKNGETSVSAKAENNMHLYWMVKRFLTHLEQNLFG